MNYNPSPRSEFCKSNANVTNHHRVVEDYELRGSLNVALLEYQQRMARLSTPDLGSCAACHLKMQGAHELLEIFFNLCETSQAAPRTDRDNLPGNVRPLPTAKKN